MSKTPVLVFVFPRGENEKSMFGLLGDTGEQLTATLRGDSLAVRMFVEVAPFLKAV
jgi:hypothetical protein